MHEILDSSALAFVGRHNSGKTTIVCALISELTRRGLDVGSVKHHGHAGFSIDVPGKDSYRHREAGARETVIASPDALARMETRDSEAEFGEIIASMPGHDIVIVEGYRQSDIPCVEVMRSASSRDREAAQEVERSGFGSAICAVVTDIPHVAQMAREAHLNVFDLPDVFDPAFASCIDALADFACTFARPHVTVAIQAGGNSTRMGRSKSLVPFMGEPLIARVIRRMMPAADEILVTTNEAERLAFLEEMFPHIPLRLVPDVHEERGALAGLYTSLVEAQCPLVASIACDMPLASPALVAYEVANMMHMDTDIVVPADRHGFEPFHAVYRAATCAPHAQRIIESGSMRIRDLLESVPRLDIRSDEVRAVVGYGGCFANANTPEELARLEERARDDTRFEKIRAIYRRRIE